MPASERPAPASPQPRAAVPWWWTALCVALVLVPFALGLRALRTQLRPVEYGDSAAYVWRQDFNRGYLTNRSLTQRALFTLAGNRPRSIARLQLAALAASALVLFALLAPRRRGGRAALAALLALFFCSYGFTAISATLVAEPLHIALLVAFPALLFLGERRPARVAAAVTGVLFVFSKNTAPFVTLMLVALHALWAGRPARPGDWRLRVGLALCALGALVVTRWDDTSLHTNLANNVMGRMLTDPAAVERLRTRDGLPPGDYVEACRGADVLTPCFGGENLHDWDPVTLHYRLRQDRYGFARWVAERGGAVWMRYLFWDRPAGTWRDYWDALRQHLASGTVAFTASYLDLAPAPPERSNLERLAEGHPARREGFLDFDPPAVLGRALAWLGLGTPWGLGALLVAGAVLLRWRPSPALALGLSLTASAAGLFFLAWFGDAMEVERHVFPALQAFCLGVALTVGAAAVTLWRAARSTTAGAVPPGA